MGTSTRELTERLTSQANELIKMYQVYDPEGRLSTVYTAPLRTGHSGPCTRVDYTYVDATSTRVEKMRESNDVWDASYDI